MLTWLLSFCASQNCKPEGNHDVSYIAKSSSFRVAFSLVRCSHLAQTTLITKLQNNVQAIFMRGITDPILSDDSRLLVKDLALW